MVKVCKEWVHVFIAPRMKDRSHISQNITSDILIDRNLSQLIFRSLFNCEVERKKVQVEKKFLFTSQNLFLRSPFNLIAESSS